MKNKIVEKKQAKTSIKILPDDLIINKILPFLNLKEIAIFLSTLEQSYVYGGNRFFNENGLRRSMAMSKENQFFYFRLWLKNMSDIRKVSEQIIDISKKVQATRLPKYTTMT